MRKISTATAGLLAIALASGAEAQARRYEFGGVLAESFEQHSAGTAFRGTFAYDLSEPGVVGPDHAARYAGGRFEIRIGAEIRESALTRIAITDAATSTADAFGLTTFSEPPLANGEWASIALLDNEGTVFPAVALPAAPMMLEPFEVTALELVDEGGRSVFSELTALCVIDGEADLDAPPCTAPDTPQSVTYHFVGVLDEAAGVHAAATPFRGSFTYSTTQVDRSASSSSPTGDYVGSELTLQIGSGHVALHFPSNICIDDGDAADPVDRFTYKALSGGASIGGTALQAASVVLMDATGTAFDGRELHAILTERAFDGGSASFVELELQADASTPARTVRGSLIALCVDDARDAVFSRGHFEDGSTSALPATLEASCRAIELR